MDIRARKYKYLLGALLQCILLYLWHKPNVKMKQILEGTEKTENIKVFLVENGKAWANIAFIAFSVFGAALFLLPLVVNKKAFSRWIDLPVLAADFLGVSLVSRFFTEKQKSARELTEYGIYTECTFTVTALLFFVFAAVQIFICIMCRIQAKREKLLQ